MAFLKSIFLLLIVLLLIILFSATKYNLNWGYWTQFSQQADSFLAGRLDIVNQLDTVYVNGKYYWHQQPLPSIILLPFKLFWSKFDQSNMQIILTILLIILLYRLIKTKNLPLLDNLYLMVVFICGSPILGLILNPSSWYYAQLVAVTLLVGLILEMETKYRPFVMGLSVALIAATRPQALLITIAIIYKLVKTNHKNILNNLSIFFLPVAITVFALLWFNYIRFNSIFYNAYQTNQVGGFMSSFRNLGFFSIQHLPTNFYYYFLISVNPVTDQTEANLIFPYITYSAWGISLILIAPFFLYALKTIICKIWEIRIYWIVIGLNLIFLMLYFAPGWVQFGPRYSADFLPLLFLLLLKQLKKPLSLKQQIIIMVSSVFNLYLYATPFLIS